MNVKQFLSKWSRTIHRWVGLYMAIIVTIYFVETLALPPIFSAGLPSINGRAPTHSVAEDTRPLLSIEQVSQAFIAQHPEGINSLNEVDAITFLPTVKTYRFENQKRFFEWYVDAYSGEVLKYGFNTNMFLEEKGVLGWLNPLVHNLIELPFLAILLTLASSGVYLFISPFLPKKNLKAEPSTIATGEH